MNQKFFVGIGAQKAGTSWLGQYFSHHPEVGFSPLKELHYFDSVYRRDLVNDRFDKLMLNKLRQLTLEIADDFADYGRIQLLRCISLRLEMFHDSQRYKDYFNFITNRSHKAFGEITPSYSLLNEDGFKAIRNLYPDARFIFILRDPVERYWSQIRFHESLVGKENFSAQDQVLAMLSNPWFSLRTDYERTLKVLYRVVPPEDVCIIFFEKLMDHHLHRNELAKITSFLEISPIEGDLSVKINAGATLELDVESRQSIASHFAHVYDYIAEHFASELPETWRKTIASHLH
jgi:hypothetical protein